MLHSCQPGSLLRKTDSAFCKDSSALKTDVKASLVSETSYFKSIAHPVDELPVDIYHSKEAMVILQLFLALYFLCKGFGGYACQLHGS